VKVESRTILGAVVFLAATAALYWVLVYQHGHKTEASGIAMLTFSACAYGILFGYLLLQYIRREGHPRPEDSFDATMADGEGEIAYFPAASIWPAGVGLGLILVACAAVWGLWYLIVGAILFFGATIGWMVESDVPEDDPNLQSPH
jgi:MFS family permease